MFVRKTSADLQLGQLFANSMRTLAKKELLPQLLTPSKPTKGHGATNGGNDRWKPTQKQRSRDYYASTSSSLVDAIIDSNEHVTASDFRLLVRGVDQYFPHGRASMVDPIRHVVVLMMENHSFDQMLGSLSSVYKDLDGIDPSNLRTNPDYPDPSKVFPSGGNKAHVHSPGSRARIREREPSAGQRQHRVCPRLRSGAPELPRPGQDADHGLFPLNYLPVLHTLAQGFAVCDRWFSHRCRAPRGRTVSLSIPEPATAT